MKNCTNCFAYVGAGTKVCPHCGAELLSAGSSKPEVEPVIVDLAIRTLDGDDAQLAFFRGEHKKARDRGWKPGAVMHRFRERFGADPPREWWGALKSDARTDGEWKGRISMRKKEATDAA
jgi:hypothetical protein